MKPKKKKQKWKQQTLRVKPNHTWRAPDGFKIVVIDRGAASFNVPTDWHLAKLDPLEMYDRPQPDDKARLMVTLMHTPPGIDWTELPLTDLLAQSTKDSSLQTLSRSEIIKAARTDLELAWTEHRFIDPEEHREAYSRIALARGWDAHVLITFDFWVDDTEKFQYVWDEAIRSLQMGRRIDDPLKGPTLH